MVKYKKLLTALLLCLSAGVIGSVATSPAISSWYALLEKPDLTPPTWLFAPVWLVLYTLMGISLYRIWSIDRKSRHHHALHTYAVYLFYIHLALNAYWSVVFFGLKDVLSALIIIVLLEMAIGILVMWFYRYDRVAGILMIPYFVWMLLASYLNYAIWILNY